MHSLTTIIFTVEIVTSIFINPASGACSMNNTEFKEVKGLFYTAMAKKENRWTVLDENYNPMQLRWEIQYNSARGKSRAERDVKMYALYRDPFTSDSSYAYFDDYVHFRTYRIIYEMSQNTYKYPLRAAISDSKEYLYGQFDRKWNPKVGVMTKMGKVITQRAKHHHGVDVPVPDPDVYHMVVVMYKSSPDEEVRWLWYWDHAVFKGYIWLIKTGPSVDPNIGDHEVCGWSQWKAWRLDTVPFYIIPAGKSSSDDVYFFIYRTSQYSVEKIDANEHSSLKGKPAHYSERRGIKIKDKPGDEKTHGSVKDIVFLYLDRKPAADKSEYVIVDANWAQYRIFIEGDLSFERDLKLAAQPVEKYIHPYTLEFVRYFDGWQTFSDNPNTLYYTGSRSMEQELETQQYDIVVKMRKEYFYLPQIVDHDVLRSPEYTILSGYIFNYKQSGAKCAFWFAGTDVNTGRVEVKFCDNPLINVSARSEFNGHIDKWPYYIVPHDDQYGFAISKDGTWRYAPITAMMKLTRQYLKPTFEGKLTRVVVNKDCPPLLTSEDIRGAGFLEKPIVRLRARTHAGRKVAQLGANSKSWLAKLWNWIRNSSRTTTSSYLPIAFSLVMAFVHS